MSVPWMDALMEVIVVAGPEGTDKPRDVTVKVELATG
jgi:hypothetical protein